MKSRKVKVYYSDNSDLKIPSLWSSVLITVPSDMPFSEMEAFLKKELIKKDINASNFTFTLYSAASPLSKEDSERSLQGMFLDRQRLGAIVDSSEDAIIGIDLEGNITSWNTSAQKMFGFEASEVLGKSDLIIVPENRQSDFDKIITAIKSGKLLDHYETERRTKDGRTIQVSISVSPIHDSHGRIVGAAKISRDITAQKINEKNLLEAKNQAVAANEAKTSFIANVSHEVRTPIGVMMGFAELLESGKLTPEEQAEAISKILKNGRIVSKLITEMIDVSKFDAGSMLIQQVDVDLPKLIEEIASSMRPKAKEKELEFQVLIKDVPQMVTTDPDRLRQILTNLVGNAIKFTTKGFVRLEVYSEMKADEFKVVFLIKDSGIGIGSEQKSLLFSRYVQADSSNTRSFGGVGLGLALSRQFAHALNGKLELDKSTPGVGSEFRLEIIPKEHSQVTLAADPIALPETLIKGNNILIVDDSSDNCLYLKKILEKRGAIVEIARDGKEGVDRALSSNFDLVLMDIQMPIMDGFSALEYLKSMNYTKPVIALTAGAMKEDQDRCLRAGFTSFLTKPVKTEVLVETISKNIR